MLELFENDSEYLLISCETGEALVVSRDHPCLKPISIEDGKNKKSNSKCLGLVSGLVGRLEAQNESDISYLLLITKVSVVAHHPHLNEWISQIEEVAAIPLDRSTSFNPVRLLQTCPHHASSLQGSGPSSAGTSSAGSEPAAPSDSSSAFSVSSKNGSTSGLTRNLIGLGSKRFGKITGKSSSSTTSKSAATSSSSSSQRSSSPVSFTPSDSNNSNGNNGSNNSSNNNSNQSSTIINNNSNQPSDAESDNNISSLNPDEILGGASCGSSSNQQNETSGGTASEASSGGTTAGTNNRTNRACIGSILKLFNDHPHAFYFIGSCRDRRRHDLTQSVQRMLRCNHPGAVDGHLSTISCSSSTSSTSKTTQPAPGGSGCSSAETMGKASGDNGGGMDGLFTGYDLRFMWNKHLLVDLQFHSPSQNKEPSPSATAGAGADDKHENPDTAPKSAADSKKVSKDKSWSGGNPWIVPIIQGYVGLEEWSEKDWPSAMKLLLISRRSVHRAGVRYIKRGIDDDGEVGNYVETEQIIHVNSHSLSFVMVRGSVPLYWCQPGLMYRPMPRLVRSKQETLPIFRQHVETQQEIYGRPIVMVNLIDFNGKESCIDGDLGEDVMYVCFDFHDHCRGMKFHNVSVLVDALEETLTSLRFTWAQADGNYMCLQNGVFRVNCMDCLDRTNVVEMWIGRRALQIQVTKLGLLSPEQPLPPQLITKFNSLWADNGDSISKQYAGTAALKGDFTRHGQRNLTGAMKDGMNSLSRYYTNHMRDAMKQTAYDLLLGQPPPEIIPTTEQEVHENLRLLVEEFVQETLGDKHQRDLPTTTDKAVAAETEENNAMGAWALVNETEVDSLLLLTRRFLYIAVMSDEEDDNGKGGAGGEQRFVETDRVPLGHILSIQFAYYLTTSWKTMRKDQGPLWMTLTLKKEECSGLKVRWRAGGTRLFNNMAMPLKSREDGDEYLRAIGHQIAVSIESCTGSPNVKVEDLGILDTRPNVLRPKAQISSFITGAGDAMKSGLSKVRGSGNSSSSSKIATNNAEGGLTGAAAAAAAAAEGDNHQSQSGGKGSGKGSGLKLNKLSTSLLENSVGLLFSEPSLRTTKQQQQKAAAAGGNKNHDGGTGGSERGSWEVVNAAAAAAERSGLSTPGGTGTTVDGGQLFGGQSQTSMGPERSSSSQGLGVAENHSDHSVERSPKISVTECNDGSNAVGSEQPPSFELGPPFFGEEGVESAEDVTKMLSGQALDEQEAVSVPPAELTHLPAPVSGQQAASSGSIKNSRSDGTLKDTGTRLMERSSRFLGESLSKIRSSGMGGSRGSGLDKQQQAALTTQPRPAFHSFHGRIANSKTKIIIL